MHKYSLAHLSQEAVLSGVKTHLGHERGSLAMGLAHIGEIEEQEYYKAAGYSSVHMYCVHELHLSKDAAYKRITAARLARKFPAIFDKVAEGALRLSALNILSAHLAPENLEELLAVAAFRSDFEVREILAERLPQAAVPTTIEPMGVQAELDSPQESVSEHVGLAAQRVHGDVGPLQLKPITADMYKATFTMSRRMRDKLRRLEDLLGYRKSVPDLVELLEASVDLHIAHIEKRKFGSASRPRAARRSKNAAHVSPQVRGEVWKRDGGRCTFVSEQGVRCPETRGLEDDHIVPVAKGGTSEPSNLRLRCRAHNQLEAERAFGKAFIENKRATAKSAAAKRREEKEARRAAQEALDNDELMPGLRGLGCTIERARSVLASVGPMEGAPMQVRLKRCLSMLAAPHTKIVPSSVTIHGTP